jgi:hypothetical protein
LCAEFKQTLARECPIHFIRCVGYGQFGWLHQSVSHVSSHLHQSVKVRVSRVSSRYVCLIA